MQSKKRNTVLLIQNKLCNEIKLLITASVDKVAPAPDAELNHQDLKLLKHREQVMIFQLQ